MTDKPLIPAATILLVRDAPHLEVLMVQRHHQIDFVPGALVFPGGKTAREDSDPAWAEHCDGFDGDPDHLALRICAIREAFEESGVLLARPAGRRGAGAPLAEAADTAAIVGLREAIDKGEVSFLRTIAEAGLVLALDALVRFAHWITPLGMPKRFDTHFYIARTPSEQLAACDGREAVDACWIRPADALADNDAGRRKIIFPTRLNVELLAGAATVDEAIAASMARRIVTVEPLIVREGETLVLTIPAEAGYAVTREPLTSANT
ncbi:MAG: NUDIX hydrolase [Hyphomonadaceae bacterium]|nr:NUDIX hydrolase [Hyphomonadaceae bacterium]